MRIRLGIGKRIMSNFMLFIGLVFFIMSFVISSQMEKAAERCTEEVPAVVSDLISVKDDEGGVTYKAEFSYTVDNKEYVVCDSTSYFPSKYQVGDEVTLKYNPDKPDDMITDKNANKFIVTIFRVLGIIVFIVGIPVKIAIRKGRL